MKNFAILVAALVAVSALPAAIVSAQEYKAGSIEVDQPWSTATPRGANVAAGYMTIKNTGTEPDRLTGVSTPVAGKVEVHEMSMENGVMTMRPLASGLEIKPGETVELKPQLVPPHVDEPQGTDRAGQAVQGDADVRKSGTG